MPWKQHKYSVPYWALERRKPNHQLISLPFPKISLPWVPARHKTPILLPNSSWIHFFLFLPGRSVQASMTFLAPLIYGNISLPSFSLDCSYSKLGNFLLFTIQLWTPRTSTFKILSIKGNIFWHITSFPFAWRNFFPHKDWISMHPVFLSSVILMALCKSQSHLSASVTTPLKYHKPSGECVFVSACPGRKCQMKP